MKLLWLKCFTSWTHNYGWPIRGTQTCRDCGKERKAQLETPVSPRFDIPRHTPVAHPLERQP